MIDFLFSLPGEYQAAIILLVLGAAGSIAGKTANPFDNMFVDWLRKVLKRD